MSKLISTFQIRFDDETKAEIAALKGKLDTVAHRLNVGHAMPTGGLLAVVAGEAANDSNSVIDRETVNDVDYLSTSLDESVPHIDDVLAYPNWLSESVPQITDADMQLIFIKNLSEVLIQRMHSMDRFSEDDYAVGGDKLIAWDILIYEPLGAYAILMRGPGRINVADLLLIREGGPMADAGWNTESEAFATLRTITEAELPAFRAALEACYA
ncbi:hypothetical protein [Psychrobacter sp. MES7-P7E]|uniref:hypothetical protein n=1 Tax=Psychrobacter sp. MES7-P7E TaxID=2058322 RepID=UPI000C7F3AC0|nr:hypothetical protein [Psychrobacter sp. MES7-P7E]PLT21300.1 hypothetical protein CXF62_11030 [Psychrobacter sp. MES7-P7E]